MWLFMWWRIWWMRCGWSLFCRLLCLTRRSGTLTLWFWLWSKKISHCSQTTRTDWTDWCHQILFPNLTKSCPWFYYLLWIVTQCYDLLYRTWNKTLRSRIFVEHNFFFFLTYPVFPNKYFLKISKNFFSSSYSIISYCNYTKNFKRIYPTSICARKM